jgi:hypothetical protein
MSRAFRISSASDGAEVDRMREKFHALPAQPCHVPGAIVEPAGLLDGHGMFGEMCEKNVQV